MWAYMQIHVIVKRVLDINFGDWTKVKAVSTEIHERLLCSRFGLCVHFNFFFLESAWFCNVASM